VDRGGVDRAFSYFRQQVSGRRTLINPARMKARETDMLSAVLGFAADPASASSANDRSAVAGIDA
jgi:hypothetical protein